MLESTPSEIAKLCLSLLDLTSLNADDNDTTIKKLCHNATTSAGNTAAICIYPQFLSLAQSLLLNTPVKLATVVNFPEGNNDPALVCQEIKATVLQGADEIDLVFPYQDYLTGKTQSALDLVRQAKDACDHDTTLKVILETGILAKPDIIYQASQDIIAAGANFLKTSTGKTSQGASLVAAESMLKAIADAKQKNIHVGIKLSGGIRTLEQTTSYIQLAQSMIGDDWITAQNFRIGASSLFNDIMEHIK